MSGKHMPDELRDAHGLRALTACDMYKVVMKTYTRHSKGWLDSTGAAAPGSAAAKQLPLHMNLQVFCSSAANSLSHVQAAVVGRRQRRVAQSMNCLSRGFTATSLYTTCIVRGYFQTVSRLGTAIYFIQGSLKLCEVAEWSRYEVGLSRTNTAASFVSGLLLTGPCVQQSVSSKACRFCSKT